MGTQNNLKIDNFAKISNHL